MKDIIIYRAQKLFKRIDFKIHISFFVEIKNLFNIKKAILFEIKKIFIWL
jgi:hypothetical protein